MSNEEFANLKSGDMVKISFPKADSADQFNWVKHVLVLERIENCIDHRGVKLLTYYETIIFASNEQSMTVASKIGDKFPLTWQANQYYSCEVVR